MWLRHLSKAAYAAKTLYTLVFFSVLTWHVFRYQTKGTITNKENR
jgi:hypothetical protein